MRSFTYSIIVLITILSACGDNTTNSSENEDEVVGMKVIGEAQGTTYAVIYLGSEENYKFQIDSLLDEFDESLSVWKENSLINQINEHNRRDTVFSFYDSTKYFSVVFDVSREIWTKTSGAFDPTVYPLVQAWGFGLKNKENITESLIDSLVQDVGFTEFDIDMIENVENEYFYSGTDIWKGNPNAKMDFNAIAQGYSVDVIAEFLLEKEIQNFMVEIGGEVYCRGLNQNDNPWRIAIDKPIDNSDSREFQAVAEISDKAIATSGNYRKFYIENGVKYSHTINPQSGYPVQHSLLSATVLANDCASADAYATAFMVMGVEQTKNFLEKYPDLGLEVYLISDNNGSFDVYMSDGMSPFIKEIEK